MARIVFLSKVFFRFSFFVFRFSFFVFSFTFSFSLYTPNAPARARAKQQSLSHSLLKLSLEHPANSKKSKILKQEKEKLLSLSVPLFAFKTPLALSGFSSEVSP